MNDKQYQPDGRSNCDRMLAGDQYIADDPELNGGSPEGCRPICTMEKSANSRFIFTGGPGAGKTTVLDALKARGFYCVPDVARAIIKSRLDSRLSSRPEPLLFANSIFNIDVANYRAAPSSEVCFFDRGAIDTLCMLHQCKALSDEEIDLNLRRYPYNSVAYLFPPWEEIYQTDDERDQTFTESVCVSETVKSWYCRCGYQVQEVPFGNINERVTFIERSVAIASAEAPPACDRYRPPCD